jgi:hypothetical protein
MHKTMHRHDKARAMGTVGGWWRFSLYEIRDGCILPAPGAKLEWYDPWPEFHSTRAQTVGQLPAGIQPAYQSLMKLVHHLEYLPGHPPHPDHLSQQSQASILEWCQQYGLLGVLLSRWQAVRVAPQHKRADQWVQRSYFRGFGQTIESQEVTGDVSDRQASVLLHGLNNLTVIEESPGKTWSRFFRDVEFSKRDTFPYPQPYSMDFCQLYGEPVVDFCNAAKLLVGAISLLAGNTPVVNGEPKLAAAQALHTINLLRRSVTSVLDFDKDGSVRSRPEAPSLLASFAEMFAQDLIYGRPTLQCICCGTPFVSGAYQALYCSVPCRLREQKRRLRAQMKQAQNLRAQGKSLRQIAVSVSQPLRIVKGWLGHKKQKRLPNAGESRP